MEAFKTPQPSEEEVAAPSLKKRVKSLLKVGAVAAASLIVGSNLDKTDPLSSDIPSHDRNNRPVPEAVANTLSQEDKEIIADKIVSISNHPDFKYYGDHVGSVNPYLSKFKESLNLKVEEVDIDMEKYNQGLMIRAIKVLLQQGFNIRETDKIEVSVYRGVPYLIKCGNRQFDYLAYSPTTPSEFAVIDREREVAQREHFDPDPSVHSTVIVLPEVIASAFKDLDNPSN